MRPSIRRLPFHLGILASLSLLLAGCGEAFVGTYQGRVKLTNSCDGQDQSPYRVTVRAQVAGDSMELTIVEFVSESNNSAGTVGARLTQVQAGMSLANDTTFGVENQPFSNVPEYSVSVVGVIAQTRDQIDNLQVTLNLLTSAGSPCKDQFTNAGFGPLTLKDR